MNKKYMRMMVFFDLPVDSPSARREAARFRKFLVKDGYAMLQYSVYVRLCAGADGVETHRQRLRASLPDNGAVRLLVLTEKQFEAIEIMLGKLTLADDAPPCEQLSIF